MTRWEEYDKDGPSVTCTFGVLVHFLCRNSTWNQDRKDRQKSQSDSGAGHSTRGNRLR